MCKRNYKWAESRIKRLMEGLPRDEAEYVFSLIIRDKGE